jgi:hypothetical protein
MVLFPVCGTVTTVQPVAADAAEAIKTDAPASAATLTHLRYIYMLRTCPPQDSWSSRYSEDAAAHLSPS